MSPDVILIGMLFSGALLSLAGYSSLACELEQIPVGEIVSMSPSNVRRPRGATAVPGR